MIYNNLNRTGQIEEIKTKNDKEIVEVYGGIGENNPIYYKKTTMEGVAPLSFKALGQPLTNYTIYGAGGVGDRTVNLFNKSNITSGYYLNSSGVPVPSANWVYSDYIDADSDTAYILQDVSSIAAATVYQRFYDADKNDIGGEETIIPNMTFTTPSEAKFIRVSVCITEIDSCMLMKGPTTAEYEPYGYKIPITCGGITTNIYRNKPICNESLNYSETEVQIPTTVGQNTLSIDTTVQPNQVTIEYKEPAKTIQEIAPLDFTSDGSPLSDYTIYGAVGGVGERTENLFRENYNQTITDNTIQYIPVLVGDGSFTLSTDCPKDSPGRIDAYTSRCIFFLPGNVSTGAQNAVNGVSLNAPKTITSVNSYVTIAYRKVESANLIPWEHHTILNKGSTPLPYEPYGYKIPITCGGEITNIYLDSPLYEGDSISLSTAGVVIPTVEGENTLTVGTMVQPSNIEISYKEPAKILTDSLPLTFTSDWSPLTNYVIYDNSVGVGERTENLFNSADSEQGFYLDDQGETTQNPNYLTSAFIPVSADTSYTISLITNYPKGGWFFRVALYDASQNFSRFVVKKMYTGDGGAVLVRTDSFTIGEAGLIRFSCLKNNLDVMLNVGSQAMSYEPYGYKIPVTCGGETTNIYMDSPLYEGDSISFSVAQIIIPTTVGQNALSIGTTVQPSKVLIEGNIKT